MADGRVEAAAMIVVDIQHDFASRDGMFGRAGIPLDAIRAVVEPTRNVLDAARTAGSLSNPSAALRGVVDAVSG